MLIFVSERCIGAIRTSDSLYFHCLSDRSVFLKSESRRIKTDSDQTGFSDFQNLLSPYSRVEVCTFRDADLPFFLSTLVCRPLPIFFFIVFFVQLTFSLLFIKIQHQKSIVAVAAMLTPYLVSLLFFYPLHNAVNNERTTDG